MPVPPVPDGVAGAGDTPPEADDDADRGPHLKRPPSDAEGRATAPAGVRRTDTRPGPAPAGGNRRALAGPGCRNSRTRSCRCAGEGRQRFSDRASTDSVVSADFGEAMPDFGRGGVVVGLEVGVTAGGLSFEEWRICRR